MDEGVRKRSGAHNKEEGHNVDILVQYLLEAVQKNHADNAQLLRYNDEAFVLASSKKGYLDKIEVDSLFTFAPEPQPENIDSKSFHMYQKCSPARIT